MVQNVPGKEKENLFMKKRNLTTIILAVAMIAVLGIGGIMAYFTDYEEVTNSFTYGQVELELTEPNWDEDLAQQVVPNETFAKDPTIKNIGVNDMFVFVEVVVPYENIITANLDGMFTCVPKNSKKMYDALRAGDEETGAKCLSNIIALRDHMLTLDLMPAYTAAMNLLGCDGNFHQDYCNPYTDATKQSMKEFMTSIGEF